MFLPYGEWLPDQADYNNPGVGTVLNVLPLTSQSYAPAPGPATTFGALAARVQGATGARDSSATSYNFAGTAAKLYELTSGSSSWSDVSISGGYSCGADEQWRFTQFGDRLLATQIADPVQSFLLGTDSAFSNLATAAPKARYMCVSRNFLLVANTDGGTADPDGTGSAPQRVWWPKEGDPTTWPTLGTVTAAADQSDAQDIVGPQGEITGIIDTVGTADALVYFKRGIYRAAYVGSPVVWGFYPRSGVRGCTVPGSIQKTEFGVIYLGPDDFYLDSADSLPIGIGNQKIAKTFLRDIDPTFLTRCCSALDPVNKIYYFAYPSLATGGGVIDTILACNYSIKSVVGTPGRWAKLNNAGMVGEYLFVSTSFGYNVDTADNTGLTIDSSPYGPDSSFWTGNQDVLAMFDTTHTLATFNGSNLPVTIETSEKQIIKGSRAAVIRCRPIGDGGTPTVTPYVRNLITGTPTAVTASIMDSNGYCFFKNAEGFYHRFRTTYPSGTTFTHLSGIDVQDDGVLNTGQR